MKVRFTRRAATELDGVLTAIDAQSPQGAQRVKLRVQETIDLLAQHPHAGHPTTKGDLRRIVVYPFPYLVFYQAGPGEIVIHGVRHAARKPIHRTTPVMNDKASMLIDTHCHLDFPDFATERDAIVARAKNAGVGRLITISTRVDRFATYAAVADAYDDVFCTVGTHPHNAHEEPEASVAEIVALAAHAKCVGIGEAGLDFHYDRSPRDIAQRVFRNHIAAARQTGLPLVIHARDADEDVAAILEDEMGKGAFKALLHCFTASRMLADRALALGLYISFSGVLTFKNSQDLRDIARDAPADRLLVETDAPYLAPVPYRGKRNEPAYVASTAAVLAETRGVEASEIASITTANALRLFSKMPPLAA